MIVLKVKLLEEIPWLFHSFFTRVGGLSLSEFESLNLSYLVGDNKDRVNENWAKVKEYLPFKEVHLLRQIHSDRLIITNTFYGKSPLWIDEGDALITSLKGLGIGVLTADCAPVVMVNRKKKVVAVVHSGWRGTVKKITTRVLEKIGDENDLKEIIVVIGPTISGERYIVGSDVVEAFNETGIDPRGIVWKDPSGNFHFDIQKAIQRELLVKGVLSNNIFTIPCCTFTSKSFFSFRRDKKTGRHLTVVGIV